MDRAISRAHSRLLVLSVIFLFLLGSTLGRLAQLSLHPSDEKRLTFESSLAQRADLRDRNGLLLATSLKTFSLYANPRVIIAPKEAARRLHSVFPHISEKTLSQRLQSSKGFVWLARHLTPAKQAEVLRLGIPGVYVMEDARRVYPYGPLFSHVVGFTDVDNQGIAGLELGLNERLKGQQEPVKLTVDARLQHILCEELQAAIKVFQAKAGNGMIVNIKTGQILAMGSLPNFDPNNLGAAKPESFFNRNTKGLFEFGSVLKIFTTAMLLEKGRNLSSVYDASTPLTVGQFRVKDLGAQNRPLTVQEAFLFSSNIAMAKMALDVGGETQQKFLKKLGFFDPLDLEIPETATPYCPSIWHNTTVITASYGYGFSITAAHLIQGVAAILHGHRKNLTFLADRTVALENDTPILSQKTAKAMRVLMRAAVQDGNAKKGNVAHYEVGGKTGTANLVRGKQYAQKNNLVTFVAALPMSDPEYAFLVSLDRPQPSRQTCGYATAGWSAAPLTARIIQRTAPLLGIPPWFPERGQPKEWLTRAVHQVHK